MTPNQLDVVLSRPTEPSDPYRGIVELDWSGIPEGSRDRFLHPGELEVIAGLIRHRFGGAAISVLETGCQNGRTARVLLDSLPEIQRYVGIDVPAGYVPAKRVQRGEVPAVPGEFALGDPRFDLIVRPRGSHEVSAVQVGHVDAAFVDGDHSRAGVLNDYRLARASGAKLIIFHDDHNLGTVDVKEVLDDLHAEGLPVVHVAGTWLAHARL